MLLLGLFKYGLYLTEGPFEEFDEDGEGFFTDGEPCVGNGIG